MQPSMRSAHPENAVTAPLAHLVSSAAGPADDLPPPPLTLARPLASDMGVSGVLARVLVEVAEQRGVARGSLLEAAELELTDLQGFDARLSLSQFQCLLAQAIRLTRDPAFGLHFGVQSSDGAFDLVGHVILHATTLRHAITACRQFSPLLMDGAQLVLSEHGETARLCCRMPRVDASLDASMAEFAVAGLLRLLRTFGGASVKPRAVHLEQARPAHHAELTKVFGGVERYRQLFNGIEFSSELLDRPHLHAHPELQVVLRTQAERSLARLSRPASFLDRLRPLFLSRGAGRIPDMDQAARELGISVRSLRRRLAEEGASYRELAQLALKERACQLLRDPECSPQQVAHALGFAEPTAFHRAFKRWTGLTPQGFRAAPHAAVRRAFKSV